MTCYYGICSLVLITLFHVNLHSVGIIILVGIHKPQATLAAWLDAVLLWYRAVPLCWGWKQIFNYNQHRVGMIFCWKLWIPCISFVDWFDAMLLLDATINIRVRYIAFLFDITLRQKIIELVLPISCFFSTSVEILSQMTLCIEILRWSNPRHKIFLLDRLCFSNPTMQIQTENLWETLPSHYFYFLMVQQIEFCFPKIPHFYWSGHYVVQQANWWESWNPLKWMLYKEKHMTCLSEMHLLRRQCFSSHNILVLCKLDTPQCRDIVHS